MRIWGREKENGRWGLKKILKYLVYNEKYMVHLFHPNFPPPKCIVCVGERERYRERKGGYKCEISLLVGLYKGG